MIRNFFRNCCQQPMQVTSERAHCSTCGSLYVGPEPSLHDLYEWMRISLSRAVRAQQVPVEMLGRAPNE